MPTKATTLDTTRHHLEDLLLVESADATPITLISSDDDLECLTDFERRWAEAEVPDPADINCK